MTAYVKVPSLDTLHDLSLNSLLVLQLPHLPPVELHRPGPGQGELLTEPSSFGAVLLVPEEPGGWAGAGADHGVLEHFLSSQLSRG